MLTIEACREVFAQSIASNASKKQSFERALIAACEFAYRRGLEDGEINLEKGLTEGVVPDTITTPTKHPGSQ